MSFIPIFSNLRKMCALDCGTITFVNKKKAQFLDSLMDKRLSFGLNIFYLYTLYIEQHIKTYNNIQYTNGIQKKVFRLIRICIPFNISILLILSRFREKTISVPMLILVLKCTTRVWKLFN